MRTLAVLLCLTCTGGFVVVPLRAMHAHRTAPRLSPCLAMGFEDGLQNMIDGVSVWFAEKSGGASQPPTASEIEEYCRDPDSSGCSVEMMDTLMAEARKLKAASPEKEIRWSVEIDDAVVKVD